MNDAIGTPDSSAQPDPVRPPRDETPHGVTFRVLASALKDIRLSEVRYNVMFRPVGLHGETFESRWDRVRSIVTTRNQRAAVAAWNAAIKAGWTEQQLTSAGLSRP